MSNEDKREDVAMNAIKNPVRVSVAHDGSEGGQPALNWAAIIVFILTAFVTFIVAPIYAVTVGISWHAVLMAVVMFFVTGMSITAGYHRLWSHNTYKAHWLPKVWFAFFGGLALQNSILSWSAGHRVHHRYVDDNEKDPYSAKKGFFWSHIGWMLRHYSHTEPDYSVTPDLQRDKIVMFQHNHYAWIAIGGNIVVPVALGLLFNDVWGYVLMVGFARIVFVHHVTFFINSLAHLWGKQPYTDENTAKDNGILSLFTFGEGYHNFHHIFQNDYRNGIRWHHFDPTKWLIKALSVLGLAKGLKKVSDYKINKRILEMQFKRAQEKAKNVGVTQHARQIMEKEYEYFMMLVNEWKNLNTERYNVAKAQFKEQVKEGVQQQIAQIEAKMQAQHKRLKLLLKQYTFA